MTGTPVWKWLVIGLITILVVGLVALFPLLHPPAIVGVRARSVGSKDQPDTSKIKLSVLSDRFIKTLSARFKGFKEVSSLRHSA